MEGQKTFAVVSGIIASLLLVTLAVVATSSPTNMNGKKLAKPTVSQNQPSKAGNNSVRAVVSTPVASDIQQSVTVK